MPSAEQQIIFENRRDAGRQLAAQLGEYQGQSVVLAIPNGGVPVAIEVAIVLKADFDVVITRKIPMPLNPEAGFGAVADDGTITIDNETVARIGLNPQQIDYQVSKVRADILQRSLRYHGDRPLTIVTGKAVIIIDDGLASGLTMRAAVESVRRRRPKEIVVAAPVAEASAQAQLEKVADRVVTCFTVSTTGFAIADFYRYWRDVSDDEVIQYIAEWRGRRFRGG
ncbi:phosphoribosyltransferase [Chloroflexota bacterium]